MCHDVSWISQNRLKPLIYKGFRHVQRRAMDVPWIAGNKKSGLSRLGID